MKIRPLRRTIVEGETVQAALGLIILALVSLYGGERPVSATI